MSRPLRILGLREVSEVSCWKVQLQPSVELRRNQAVGLPRLPCWQICVRGKAKVHRVCEGKLLQGHGSDFACSVPALRDEGVQGWRGDGVHARQQHVRRLPARQVQDKAGHEDLFAMRQVPAWLPSLGLQGSFRGRVHPVPCWLCLPRWRARPDDADDQVPSCQEGGLLRVPGRGRRAQVRSHQVGGGCHPAAHRSARSQSSRGCTRVRTHNFRSATTGGQWLVSGDYK